MDSAGESAQLCYYSDQNKQCAETAAANAEGKKLGPLTMEDRYLQITVAPGELPQFIIDANEAVRARKIEEALNILSEETIETFLEQIERGKYETVAMLALAKLLFDVGKLPEAERWYKKILERGPHAFVYNAVADICLAQGHLSEETKYRRKAVETAPDDPSYWVDFAGSLMRTHCWNEGIDLLRKRVEAAPANDSVAGSVLLWQLHHCPESTPEMFFEEYEKWARTYVPISRAKAYHKNDPNPDRRLRIGYISPDFRNNVVSQAFELFLDGHDRREFEVYGYGNVAKPDITTERLKGKFDHYRGLDGMTLGEVVQSVEDDQIDILIEIGGHSRDNCLGVMAYKPAPVQIDYGGIDTTGMKQMDYRLTDRLVTPEKMEEFYVEESICLTGGIFSCRPPHHSPLVGPIPAKSNGYVTFGSFNNSAKVNSYTIELWARVLKADEQSRFLFKFRGGNDRELRDRYLSEFESFGVCRDRIDVYDVFPSHFEHLQLYGKVDILLDSYPFNGCMTTMEGLWMGVPTISLTGERIALSRSGLSILSRVGLEIFTAPTPDEYVAKANAFAKELDNLEIIRASLRQMTLDSSLCSPTRFTQEIETAYRNVWHRWCGEHNTNPTT